MIPAGAQTISVFRDGDKFCAVETEFFENIQESNVGYGDTRMEAIANLIELTDAPQ